MGNSSITFYKPRLVFGFNGGPQPSGFRFIGTADYKETKTLKSCQTEFRLIPPVRLLIESRLAIDLIKLQSAFHFIYPFMNLVKQYWELFLVFFKIGAFTFGGGYAMIPLIRNEVVNKKKWLADNEFMDMLALAQSVPGPISLNTAIFVGNKRLGFKGSLFTGAGVILPSFIVILFIAVLFTQFKDNPFIERIFKGIRPAVVALIAAPLLGLGKSAGVKLNNIWIPISVALSVWLLNLSPVYIILISIIFGILYFLFLKLKSKK